MPGASASPARGSAAASGRGAAVGEVEQERELAAEAGGLAALAGGDVRRAGAVAVQRRDLGEQARPARQHRVAAAGWPR